MIHNCLTRPSNYLWKSKAQNPQLAERGTAAIHIKKRSQGMADRYEEKERFDGTKVKILVPD
ncbi:MAG: hypothetical protein V2B18_22065, partial [Pseudomonadota bacterium]